MVAKDSVKLRFERPDQGISYTEFSYMLLQAYDFLRLHVDHGCACRSAGATSGATSPWASSWIHKCCGDEVWGLTTPLVLKADGTKFGKTEKGTVWLDAERTSPTTCTSSSFNSPDEMVGAYLRYFTFLTHAQITELDAEISEHPERREAQRAPGPLRGRVGARTSGGDRRRRRRSGSFRRGVSRTSARTCSFAVTQDAPTTQIPRSAILEGLPLVGALISAELVASKGEARPDHRGGGAYVNNQRQSDTARI